MEELVRDVEEGTAGGFGGRAHQFHVRLLGGSAGFFAVTFHAGTDHVLPGMFAVAEAGHHVVERKMFTLGAAILAGVMVTVKDFIAGHLALAARTADKLIEPDNRRKLDRLCECMDVTRAVFNHYRLALEDKDDGAAGAAYGKRLVTLIQDQYRMVQHSVTREEDAFIKSTSSLIL